MCKLIEWMNVTLITSSRDDFIGWLLRQVLKAWLASTIDPEHCGFADNFTGVLVQIVDVARPCRRRLLLAQLQQNESIKPVEGVGQQMLLTATEAKKMRTSARKAPPQISLNTCGLRNIRGRQRR
jgi:hypothetical protein